MGAFPEYAKFISEIAEAGYRFATMSAGAPSPETTIYLRHDIDFDTEYALRMAKIEAQMGVAATYYFMLSSDSYNPLSSYNSHRIREIAALGHKISLHFDPVIYDDMEQGLLREVAVFRDAFGVPVDIISIHRPNEAILSHEGEIAGIAHTYQSRYSKDVFYCSDSQGRWRFGSPLDSQAFANRTTIHLLTHPIWWVRGEAESQAQLDGYVSDRIERFLTHIEANCRSFSKALSVHNVAY
ncbi:hypothetical protein GCM10007859_01750 [Brevundimonas denitrificans]|uniref:Uncharacterized protein n=1 Tax=Brevundimonas denitrificans TaxID=1443434 RepID=A0ABQ6BDY5_9CAUL|nr:hypothetical protein [Brevundimonas denitrificans]GLS00171.1 hypothetical protein GCM10007859_01750 [Brevundimonas denitrificans]